MKVPALPESYIPVIAIEQYRQMTGDNDTSDVLVRQRIFYIERLCRGVITSELKKTTEKDSKL